VKSRRKRVYSSDCHLACVFFLFIAAEKVYVDNIKMFHNFLARGNPSGDGNIAAESSRFLCSIPIHPPLCLPIISSHIWEYSHIVCKPGIPSPLGILREILHDKIFREKGLKTIPCAATPILR